MCCTVCVVVIHVLYCVCSSRTCAVLCVYAVEPLNVSHIGDDINSAYLLFLERFSSLEGLKCFVGIILGP